MKYLKKIVVICIFAFSAGVMLKLFDFYPHRLTKEFIITKTITNGYVIKKNYFGKSYVKEMGSLSEWTIKSNAIYGYKGDKYNLEDDYFYLDTANDSVVFFGELSELNKFLTKKGYDNYDISDSEKILHLRRSERKYKY